MLSDTVFTIVFDGQEISVHHRPHYFSGYDHFEFVSPHIPAKPILVSETGYRSHFAASVEVSAAPSIEIYAHALLSAFMESARPADPNQFTLF